VTNEGGEPKGSALDSGQVVYLRNILSLCQKRPFGFQCSLQLILREEVPNSDERPGDGGGVKEL
jgi:hypothetical protein